MKLKPKVLYIENYVKTKIVVNNVYTFVQTYKFLFPSIMRFHFIYTWLLNYNHMVIDFNINVINLTLCVLYRKCILSELNNYILPIDFM